MKSNRYPSQEYYRQSKYFNMYSGCEEEGFDYNNRYKPGTEEVDVDEYLNDVPTDFIWKENSEYNKRPKRSSRSGRDMFLRSHSRSRSPHRKSRFHRRSRSTHRRSSSSHRSRCKHKIGRSIRSRSKSNHRASNSSHSRSKSYNSENIDMNSSSSDDSRFRKSKSPIYKAEKLKSRCDGYYKKSKSCFSRNSHFKKRHRSFTKSSLSPVCKRLDISETDERLKNTFLRDSFSPGREEIENSKSFGEIVKLSEEEVRDNAKKVLEKEDETEPSMSEVTPAGWVQSVESSIRQNPTPQLSSNGVPPTLNRVPYCSNYLRSFSNPSRKYSWHRFPFKCSMPNRSVENLPLKRGPRGLPVHITVTGEVIPHDMEGRRIPIGPNGFYLPLDPSGRLFPHVISPRNGAVPIHMTADGVLRLPNSEPVPYGPGHNFPMDIDGSVIIMGPDSRPLVPCSDLPTTPPFEFMQVSHFSMISAFHRRKQHSISVAPETSQRVKNDTTQSKTCRAKRVNPVETPPPQEKKSTKEEITRNTNEEANKADSQIIYGKKIGVKVPKCKDNEKNSNVKTSERFEKLIPQTLLRKENCSGEDKSLKTNNADSAKVSKLPPKKMSKGNNFKEDKNLDPDISDFSGDSKILPKKISKEDSVGEDKNLVTNAENASELLLKTKKDCVDKIETLEFMGNVVKIACDNETEKDPSVKSESKLREFIIKKVELAIKSLNENNFKPPRIGRFIISKFLIQPTRETSPNASPLLRNRIKLPFLMPNFKEENPTTTDKSFITRESPTKEITPKMEKKMEVSRKPEHESTRGDQFPDLTLDFAVQCDFTTVIINGLISKVTKMEMEVKRLQSINTNLLDGLKNAHEAKEKKSEELGKALLEIQKGKNEILSLKSLISKKGIKETSCT